MAGPVERGPGAALTWLAHPVTVLSLVVLVVNDHLLKTAYPGIVTGKLSDLAGLVLAPPLLALVVTLVIPRLSGRLAAAGAVAATGVGFAAVKATGAGAAAASATWSVVNGSSVVLADLTDLIGLPALGLSWWVWSRAARRPAPPRLVRLARVVIVLPAAAFAVAATSAPQYPYYPDLGQRPRSGRERRRHTRRRGRAAQVDSASGRPSKSTTAYRPSFSSRW